MNVAPDKQSSVLSLYLSLQQLNDLQFSLVRNSESAAEQISWSERRGEERRVQSGVQLK